MKPWLTDSLIVAVGASFGANGRYWLGAWVQSRAEPPFPWSTFWVNLSGCLAIGIVAGILLNSNLSPSWRTLIIVGFLGGYTTFSSFSLETYNLLRGGEYLYAGANVVGSVTLGLLGTWIGDMISRLVTGAR